MTASVASAGLMVRVGPTTPAELPVPGASHIYAANGLCSALGASDRVIEAAPSTPDTRHLVGSDELALLQHTSWVVNVGRGSLVDTEALCKALNEEVMAGAAADVTAPEPLPPEHPLWKEPRVIITTHAANPPAAWWRAFVARVDANLKHRPLVGRVNVETG